MARVATAVVTACVVVLAAALAGCGSTAPTAHAGFAGYWRSAPGSSLGGTLLIRIDKRGQAYSIAGLNFLGAGGDLATPEGARKLVVRGRGAKSRDYRAEFTLGANDSSMTMALVRAGQGGAPVLSVEMVRATGSDAQLAAALAAQEYHVRVLRVEEGVHTLQAGLAAWAKDHGGAYPPVAAVRPGATLENRYIRARLHATWPANPFAGGKMSPGATAGNFTYTVGAERRSYSLAAHFPEGADYVVP